VLCLFPEKADLTEGEVGAGGGGDSGGPAGGVGVAEGDGGAAGAEVHLIKPHFGQNLRIKSNLQKFNLVIMTLYDLKTF
jgi:hypothetical protein